MLDGTAPIVERAEKPAEVVDEDGIGVAGVAPIVDEAPAVASIDSFESLQPLTTATTVITIAIQILFEGLILWALALERFVGSRFGSMFSSPSFSPFDVRPSTIDSARCATSLRRHGRARRVRVASTPSARARKR